MDKIWLIKIFQDVGLEPDQADVAADLTLRRLLRRERPRDPGDRRRSLVEHLVRDPLVSMNRIIGRGDGGLPFVDGETGRLSTGAVGNVLSDAGLDPVVAMAFAKVVAEAFEPSDLYAPVWIGLGQTGPLDLEVLRRMDWSPLRAAFPELFVKPGQPDLERTEQVRVKPRARPPSLAEKRTTVVRARPPRPGDKK